MTDENGGSFYVLSSSGVFNDDMLRNAFLSNDLNYLTKNNLGTYHVDKRDGFPNYMLVAKYVLVAYPIQLHLPQGQEVVSYLASKIINRQNTQNLVPIKVFYLKPNIKVTVYERTGGYSMEFLEDVKSHFSALYPNYENLTNIDFIHSME